MKKQFPDRIEIFLALAVKNIRRSDSSVGTFTFEKIADLPDQTEENKREPSNELSETMPALFNYLNKAETEKLERLWSEFQNKNTAEKDEWQTRIFSRIGTDEQFVDEQIHQSHLVAALEKESSGIQRIVKRLLPSDFKTSAGEIGGAEISAGSKKALPLEKIVRRAFAKQFVSLRDLKKIAAFDRLNGAQMARLIRLTGIREVATACVRIEAVEAVAAFLRIFSAEDAQAIAAQLNALPTLGDGRLSFAETIVQATLEDEPQPSAMLDWLGIRLLAIFLGGEDDARVRYAKQKLPLELFPRLTEIIDEQRRETNAYLRRQIAVEIERLADTLFRPKNAKI